MALPSVRLALGFQRRKHLTERCRAMLYKASRWRGCAEQRRGDDVRESFTGRIGRLAEGRP